MTEHTAEPGVAQAIVERRRARVRCAAGTHRQPVGVHAESLPRERAEYLRKEAEELYWNELAWEELTDEEVVSGGHLTELAFTGFLAFVDGLLLDGTPAESLAPARPHPDVIEEILVFLAEQVAAFTAELEGGADSQRVVWARSMTERLIDLVLCRLYQLTPEECEEVDAGE
ncbi:MAG TPA: hypothetical protein VFL93_16515 [Longimicrobiaceae bacterium]|nr:hypothetical protein [Longimicrobiaceae bacterium]